MSLDMQKIKVNAPLTAEYFAPAPQWVGGAFYFKKYGEKILMIDIDNKWVHACDTIQELFERGGLPLSYEPIDWINVLEKV